ncbi:MAG: sigma-E factor negative regulatory protein [Gammaproteobacteria bacterium]|nr:sigma-E factor negative regulatory protein [Gammaproteobacteria bacterium]
MNNDIEEQLSALLDDELLIDHISDTSARISSSDELRGAWDRYHLIGDVMRGEGVRLTGPSVADLVKRQLQSEPPILAAPKQSIPKKPKQSNWLRPAAGAALAASVAVVAVYSLQSPTGPGPMGTDNRVAGIPAGNARITPAAATDRNEIRSGTRWKNLSEPGLESRLNRYLVNHNEYASPGGVNGLLPYTSFVSYDTGRP